MKTKLDIAWSNFVIDMIAEPASGYSQIRKIIRGASWIVGGEEWDGLSLGPENLGYSAGPSKMNQLKRNYLNLEEVHRVRDTLISRLGKDQTCVTGRFGNHKKDSRSQGFCMQTFSLNYIKSPSPGNPRLVVEIYYRSTECLAKFYADLLFLDQVVFPELLEGLPKPDEIRFVFSSLYVSSMFLPILFQIVPMKDIVIISKGEDPHWWRRAVKYTCNKYLQKEHNYTYRTRVKLHDVFSRFVRPKIGRKDLAEIRRLIDED